MRAPARPLAHDLAHASARRDRVAGPDHVDQPHVELAAGEESLTVAVGREVGDEAHRHHPLHDDVRETERPRHLDVGVVVPVRSGERLAHCVRDRARRQRDGLAVARRRRKPALGLFLARAIDDQLTGGLSGEETLMRAAALQPAAIGVGK
jgi:hypothetical protein